MKKIYLMAIVAAFAFTSCEDALDPGTPVTKTTTGGFPSTISDVDKELASIYTIMGCIQASPLQNPLFISDIMSDDCFGGGGTGDNEAKAVEHFTLFSTSMYDNLWKYLYRGIYRCNVMIETIDNVPWNNNTADRNQALGEAFFMRAHYYMWASQTFGNIPLVLTSNVPNPCPDASAENEIWPQILSDLVSASELMTGAKNDGHASKYAAEALLARAYMYYVGFYKNAGELANANPEAVALVEQEGCTKTTLSKSDVVAYLQNVVSAGGYKLLDDFRSLWQYSNSLTAADYDYVKDMDASALFDVTGNGNGNDEEIFQIQYMNASVWNYYDANGNNIGNFEALSYSNQASLYMGLRTGGNNGEVDHTFPFGQGWGMGTVSANIFSEWSDNDLRKKASIIDCQKELKDYQFVSDCSEDAGYANKKYQPVTCMESGSSLTPWWMYTAESPSLTSSDGNSMQGAHFEDTYLIRYADVLLMLTELTGDASYMNQVRKRAGLDDTTYSWANLKAERRHELAFEGLRYNDLRRWSGINATASSEICQALDAQAGQDINVCGNWTKMKHMNSSWSQRYIATKGFLPKPATQVTLSDGAMTQNEGWSGTDAAYTSIY